MNKYQEALNDIKDYSFDTERLKDDFDTLQELIDRQKEVEAIANDCNELIDKSMPKKFKRIKPFVYECPTCKERYDLNEYDGNYCMNCGQKIDWSDWV